MPNAGFEDGVNKTAAQGIDQPLLPVGWAFEGVAALFDHSPHEKKSGRYSAAISIPASGKPRVCADPPVGCHPLDPVNAAKETAATAYSVSPAWRPALPVNVAAGGRYIVSGWMAWQLASIDEGGALVRVRWLDGNGVPLRTVTALKRIARTQLESENLNWTHFAVAVVAPPGAAKAIPLFGAADDVFLTKVNYDDVSFHAA